MDTDRLLWFWAKSSKKAKTELRYPLLYHMLDVTAVVRELWQQSLHSGAKQFMAEELHLTGDETIKMVSFWAGLHDLGKASPGFQSKSETAKKELQKQGFSISNKDPGHNIITTYLLRDLLQSTMNASLAKQIATTVGGHHGIFPRSVDIQSARHHAGNSLHRKAQQELFQQFSCLCELESGQPISSAPSPAFFMFLAGLTSVADWIASNEKYFPYDISHQLEDHLVYAEKKANKALDQLGWTGWQPPLATAEIQRLFPHIKEVRPLQQEAVDLATSLHSEPALVIIEAPMGEGKTEAAMYLADSWAVALGQKGCYFALPTMATSNQMFGRVKDFLTNRYQDERVNLMLLHGHASLSAEFEDLLKSFDTQNICDDEGYDGASAGVVASEWFTYRKRGLLAPFGVGTIDQVLLSVLQTRHVFVRLFGLACKTIIIDEVHAYDIYMTTLLERLLEWLAAVGSSVVMLSATLPRARRDALLKAYAKGQQKTDKPILSEVGRDEYPRITWTTPQGYDVKIIGTSRYAIKRLHLKWIDGRLPEGGSEFCLGRMLNEALADNGCAAVICNTVDQAQKIYLALKPYFPEQNAGDGFPELDLLHARYLYGDRDAREKRSLQRFGKDGSYRPRRAVLVATQVIEQSLDIDFDLMVTEMAPVDLLLQRAGRLHRHEREKRPDRLKETTLWICQPELDKGVPNFGSGTEAVYDSHVLLRSWLAIKDRELVKIPEGVEELIEEVYGERECPNQLPEAVKKEWEESLVQLIIARNNYESKAKANRILPSNYDVDSLLEAFNKRLEEDNPMVHEALQALTRLSEEPMVSVVCLYGTKENPTFLGETVNTKSCPDADMTRKLLEHSLRISRRGLAFKIIKEGAPVPDEWRKKPQLRHHYLLFFGDNRSCLVGDHELKLSNELGLTIQKKEG